MKTDIICLMRLLAVMMLSSTMAFGVTVEPLPPPEYADTEVIIGWERFEIEMRSCGFLVDLR